MNLFHVKCLTKLNIQAKINSKAYPTSHCLQISADNQLGFNFYFDHNFNVDQVFIVEHYGRIVANLEKTKIAVHTEPYQFKLADTLHRDPGRFQDNLNMIVSYIEKQCNSKQ